MKEEFIPRSAALSKTHDIHVKSKAGDVDYYHRCIDPSDIEEIPAANVRKAKRGEWISVNDGKSKVTMKRGVPQESCFCSVCGAWLVASDEYDVKGNFCPMCGAEMKGEA